MPLLRSRSLLSPLPPTQATLCLPLKHNAPPSKAPKLCSYASLANTFYLVLSQEQVFSRLHEVALKNQSPFLGRGSAHTQCPWEGLSWGQLDTLYHPCLCLQPGVGIRAARNIPLQGWEGHSCLESCRAVEERVTEELLGSASESPHTQTDACFRQTDRCAMCAPTDSPTQLNTTQLHLPAHPCQAAQSKAITGLFQVIKEEDVAT